MTTRTISSVVRPLTLTVALCGLTLAAEQPTHAPVTGQDLLAGLKNQTRWLTFSGNYTGQRHSPLEQLTPKNVAGLVPLWVFQTDVPGLPGRAIETSPLVVDGILYITGNNNQAWAVDARTARPLWNYRRALPQNFAASVCCGPVNRGFEIGRASCRERVYVLV